MWCIFLGYGNGTFANQTTYSTGYDSRPLSKFAAIGDFNNDSRLDIVVINQGGFENVGVFLGYGNGSFSSQTTYSTRRAGGPSDIVVGDLNNDGRLDIVVVLKTASGIMVFLGNGNGTFSRSLIYSTGSQSTPYACALGDVNNDNRLDIVVSDSINGEIIVLLGDGNGNFSSIISYSTGSGSSPQSVAFGDFNNDGILDIVGANYNNNTIGVFLGFSYINGVHESVCSTGSSPHPRAPSLLVISTRTLN